METFSGSECIRFGWETFKKRPWFLVGAFFLVTLITSIISSIVNQVFPADDGGTSLTGFLVSIPVQVLASIATTSFALKANDNVESAQIRDLWRPQFFVNYLCMSILFFIAAAVGFVLFIIPGFVVIVMYYFACYFVVDRSLGPVVAMKESARITKGHRSQILGLLALIVLLNLLGLLALVIGLLVTVPVTFLAVAHAYRTLSAQAKTPAAA